MNYLIGHCFYLLDLVVSHGKQLTQNNISAMELDLFTGYHHKPKSAYVIAAL